MAKTAAREAPSGSESRERILQAALGAFAEKGFEGASTREIASRAGVNHGLIPYYFGAKEQLWRLAVDRVFEEMETGLEAVLRDTSIRDGRERAARVIRGHVHFVARRPEFLRLMHDEGRRRGPRMRWIVDRHVKPMVAAFSELLEGAPVRVQAPPIHLFYVVAGACGLMFHQAEECRRVSGIDPFASEVVEEHARVVEELLLGPREPGA